MVGLSLDEHDVAELVALLELVGSGAEEALAWPFMHRLKALIGCDVLAFFGLDSDREAGYVHQETEGPDHEVVVSAVELSVESLPHGEDPFWLHYWSSPPCSHQEVTGDFRSVTTIGDFYSVRQWRSHPMFVEGHEAAPCMTYEMLLCFSDGPGRTMRLMCLRAPPARDFGERERLLVTLLRPHIIEAYRAMQRHRALESLTPRQSAVVDLLGDGLTNRQIARRLGMSEATVRTHLSSIFERLEVSSRTEAAARVVGLGNYP